MVALNDRIPLTGKLVTLYTASHYERRCVFLAPSAVYSASLLCIYVHGEIILGVDRLQGKEGTFNEADSRSGFMH